MDHSRRKPEGAAHEDDQNALTRVSRGNGAHESVGRRITRGGKVLIFGGVALAIVVGLSALVGDVGSEQKFDWELAGVFGTALGTTLLAMTIGLLAWLTSGDVRATQDLASSRARIRPSKSYRSASNVGLEPALDVEAEATYIGEHPRPHMCRARSQQSSDRLFVNRPRLSRTGFGLPPLRIEVRRPATA